MISNFRTAYKIGFSSSLFLGSISAYQEAAKYKFSDVSTTRLKSAFYRGYALGLKIRNEVRKENLVAGREHNVA